MEKRKCTYIDLLQKIPSLSHDVLAFRSTNLRSGNLLESMTQCGEEILVGRWRRGMQRRLYARLGGALDQSYLRNSQLLQ